MNEKTFSQQEEIDSLKAENARLLQRLQDSEELAAHFETQLHKAGIQPSFTVPPPDPTDGDHGAAGHVPRVSARDYIALAQEREAQARAELAACKAALAALKAEKE